MKMLKNVVNTDQGSLFPIFADFMSAITHSGAVTSLVPPESHPEKSSGKCKIRPGIIIPQKVILRKALEM